MTIAHLIIAHKDPPQLERLVKRLIHRKSDIYIHLDKKVNITGYRYLADLGRVYFIKGRILCTWGGFSLVKAITHSVKEILNSSRRYEYINLISAQDYPIKSLDSFYHHIQDSNGKSYIPYEAVEGSSWWKHAVSRYELYHFTDIRIRGKYIVQYVLNKYLPKRRFPLPYDLYGSPSATWWTLHRDCLRYVIDFLAEEPNLMRFMKYTWGADEFLFPTIIMNSPFRDSVENTNFRRIEFPAGKANPKVYVTEDFDELIRSDCFFARKFDIKVDAKILDLLDGSCLRH